MHLQKPHQTLPYSRQKAGHSWGRFGLLAVQHPWFYHDDDDDHDDIFIWYNRGLLPVYVYFADILMFRQWRGIGFIFWAILTFWRNLGKSKEVEIDILLQSAEILIMPLESQCSRKQHPHAASMINGLICLQWLCWQHLCSCSLKGLGACIYW